MHIPFHKPYITEAEINAVTECLSRGWLTMGDQTLQFEKEFQTYIQAKNAIALSSCTAALHLALHCINLTQHDEVLIPTTTFAATAEVVCYYGAKPVFVDVDRETHLIDVVDVAKKITPRTRAIIPVHFAGQPADMDSLMNIARQNNLFIIEDAAHALPAFYKERPIGSIGDMTCFSFYATKTLATGEGGMLTTANDEIAMRVRQLRLHGMSHDAWKRYNGQHTWKYDVVEPGFKYNMTDLEAAIGREQLKKADLLWNKRKKIAARYTEAFTQSESIIPYTVRSDRQTAWHLYPVKLNLDRLELSRDSFIEELRSRGIATSVHFIPLYHFSYYQKMGYNRHEYPHSEWIFEREVSLPMYPGMRDEEVTYVIENVLDIVKRKQR